MHCYLKKVSVTKCLFVFSCCLFVIISALNQTGFELLKCLLDILFEIIHWNPAGDLIRLLWHCDTQARLLTGYGTPELEVSQRRKWARNPQTVIPLRFGRWLWSASLSSSTITLVTPPDPHTQTCSSAPDITHPIRGSPSFNLDIYPTPMWAIDSCCGSALRKFPFMWRCKLTGLPAYWFIVAHRFDVPHCWILFSFHLICRL